MLLAAVLLTTIYLALAALVIAVDPYNVYRWGAQPRIDPNSALRDLVIDWIDVAAKDPDFDTFLIGSSVTQMYTPENTREFLGPDAHLINLSYGGPRPLDRDLVLNQLLEGDTIKHVILTFDWTYIREPDATNIYFPTFLYDDDIGNDLRMVNFPTIRTTFDILAGKRIYTHPDPSAYGRYVEDMYENFQRPEEMAKIERVVERYRSQIGRSSGRACDSFGAINEQLVPDLKALSDKGVKVDVMIPIFSYAFYYVRRDDISDTLLDEMMVARRCLVEAASDLPNVSIYAFDDDPAVAGDLANFREVGHVYNPDILRRFISATATGKDRLTRENLPAHEKAIRSAVENYRLTNSYLDMMPAAPEATRASSHPST